MTGFARKSELRGCRWNRTAAFTLVELIAALALTVILTAAVSSAVSIFSRLETAGRSQAEEGQLARALTRQFQVDIHSVVFRPTTAATTATTSTATTSSASNTGSTSSAISGGTSGTSSTTAASSTGSTTQSTTTNGDGSTSSLPPGANLGVMGDATSLTLQINRPIRAFSSVASVDSTESETTSAGDLVTVSYVIATPGGSGLSGRIGEQLFSSISVNPSELAQGNGEGAIGLARAETSKQAFQSRDEDLLTSLSENATLLAREVMDLQFEYFDGTAWYPSWDSVAMNATPRAIAITMVLRERQIGVAPNQNTGLSGRVLRFVVDLPTAPPIVTSTTL